MHKVIVPSPYRDPADVRFPASTAIATAITIDMLDRMLPATPDPLPVRDIVVVHSSDLHIDHDYTARLHGGDGTAGLACVLQAARSAGADVVLLPSSGSRSGAARIATTAT